MILMLDEELDEFESEKNTTLFKQIKNLLNEKTLKDPPAPRQLDFVPKNKQINDKTEFCVR